MKTSIKEKAVAIKCMFPKFYSKHRLYNNASWLKVGTCKHRLRRTKSVCDELQRAFQPLLWVNRIQHQNY